jgi:dimethylhistidine N-methyltransferase
MNDGSLAAFHDFSPPQENFRDAVLTGLAGTRKAISSKFLYDTEGSRLFESIPTLDEYYQTRTEIALLRTHSAEIAALCGPACYLVEYGSGSCEKIRILLDAVEDPCAYVPIDISADPLRAAAERLARDYPHVPVHAICADLMRKFDLPEVAGREQGRRIGFFLGATIGNFTLEEAEEFLSQAQRMLTDGGLLIGVDLKKDTAVLEAAYNDSRGVSSTFNLNLLSRINRELGADIDVSAFCHSAVYDPEKGRMEIGIKCLRDQTLRVLGHEFRLRGGEIIYTQHAYKFTVDEFQDLAAKGGFTADRIWVDNHGLYGLFFLKAHEAVTAPQVPRQQAARRAGHLGCIIQVAVQQTFPAILHRT